jgi:hypothetical protein
MWRNYAARPFVPLMAQRHPLRFLFRSSLGNGAFNPKLKGSI